MAVMLGRCALLFCFLHVAWSQEADVTVTVVDISDQDVFLNIITAPEALPGLAWIFLTAPGAEPTPTEMKSGSGAVGPASCQDLADAITLPDATLGLVFCNLPYGAEYTLQVYFEGNGTRLLRQNVTVPVEPSPLPTGPFCFDIDYDYGEQHHGCRLRRLPSALCGQRHVPPLPLCLRRFFSRLPALRPPLLRASQRQRLASRGFPYGAAELR